MYFQLLLQTGVALIMLRLFLSLLSQPLKKQMNMVEDSETKKKSWVDPAPTKPETQSGDFDRILDFVLRYVTHNLTKQSEEHPVPNLDLRYPLVYGIFQTECQLSAKNGVLHDLSTLHRHDSATTHTHAGEGLLLEATAGLSQLRLHYHQYTLRVGMFCVSGTLEARWSPVRLRAQVALSPPLTAELRSLSLAQMGRLQLDATGLGILGSLLPYVQSWLDERLFHYMQTAAMEHLKLLVDDTLRSFSRKTKSIPQFQLFSNCKKALPSTGAKMAVGVEEDFERMDNRGEEIKRLDNRDEEKFERLDSRDKEEREIVKTIERMKIESTERRLDPGTKKFLLFHASMPPHFQNRVEHKLQPPLRIGC